MPVTRAPLILIVDDEVVTNRMIVSILEKSGYRTESAFTLGSAILAIEKNKPDLIILDVNLPDGSGFELCLNLRKKHGAEQLPILFISANDDIDAKLQGFESGGVDYITKPVAGAEVLARVGTHLRLKQAYAALAESQAASILKLARAQERVMPRPESMPEARFFVSLTQVLTAGGDFYDVVTPGEGITDYLVADTSGHDLAATFWTAMLKTLFIENLGLAQSQTDVLHAINKALCHALPPGVFFTIIYARVNRKTGTLSIVNAGHPPLVLAPKNGSGIRIIHLDGDVVGAFEDASWGQTEVAVQPGDRFLLYSDGLVEANGGLESGIGHLCAAVTAHGSTADLAAFVRAIVTETLGGSPPKDDIVCLGVEI